MFCLEKMGLHVSTFGMCKEGYFRVGALKRDTRLEMMFLVVFIDTVRPMLFYIPKSTILHHKLKYTEAAKGGFIRPIT